MDAAVADAAVDAGADGGLEGDAGACSDDLTSDAKNCGKCGHDCLGGTCVASQCTPVPIISNETGVLGVAVDGTDLYWSRFDGAVRTSRLDGTSPGDLRKLNGAGHIAVDDTYVYVAGFGAIPVSRFRKDNTGPVEALAPCNGECLGVAVTTGRVYFTERALGGVGNLRVAESDGGSTLLLGDLSFPEHLFAAPTRLLIANEGGNDIVELPYGSTTSAVFASVPDPVSVVADATDVWIVSQNTKTIRRRALAGGPIFTVATLPSIAYGLAQNATALYWANDDGTILRLAK